jgi:hypothetical protein
MAKRKEVKNEDAEYASYIQKLDPKKLCDQFLSGIWMESECFAQLVYCVAKSEAETVVQSVPVEVRNKFRIWIQSMPLRDVDVINLGPPMRKRWIAKFKQYFQEHPNE